MVDSFVPRVALDDSLRISVLAFDLLPYHLPQTCHSPCLLGTPSWLGLLRTCACHRAGLSPNSTAYYFLLDPIDLPNPIPVHHHLQHLVRCDRCPLRVVLAHCSDPWLGFVVEFWLWFLMLMSFLKWKPLLMFEMMVAHLMERRLVAQILWILVAVVL